MEEEKYLAKNAPRSVFMFSSLLLTAVVYFVRSLFSYFARTIIICIIFVTIFPFSQHSISLLHIRPLRNVICFPYLLLLVPLIRRFVHSFHVLGNKISFWVHASHQLAFFVVSNSFFLWYFYTWFGFVVRKLHICLFYFSPASTKYIVLFGHLFDVRISIHTLAISMAHKT